MNEPIRQVKLSTGHILSLYDTGRTSAAWPHKTLLGYEFVQPDGVVLFEGEKFGASPMHAIDADATLLSLLSFLTLRPGDTDSEYFEDYTAEQRAWSESSTCEMLAADVAIAEEQSRGGCACAMWENLDGHVCDDAGNVAEFEVLDHGEDGSQYFPGCGVALSKFAHVATGVGDTGAEAFDDALEQMATGEPEARMSKLQEAQAREYLRDPNKSASDGLDVDWSHYVSVRYNVREDK